MSSPSTILDRIASWAQNLRWEDVPLPVIDMARAQQRDCLAAICAGSRSEAGQKLYRSLQKTATPGPCDVFPYQDKWNPDSAIYLHAALINALELDNFAVMGHFGQSAFAVSRAVAQLLHKSPEEELLSLIIANEIEGRLGAYLATGPQQGHMRTFLHRIGGAAVTAKLLDLPPRQTAEAYAIALSMPEFAMYPTAFSPETKVIQCSAPSVEGFRTAFMAAEGLSATRDIFEHPVGFWSSFSHGKRVLDPWRHIGETWTLHALSFKDQAACAYSQGPVAACREILTGNPIAPDAIEKIEVDLGLVSLIMESFSRPHWGAGLTPVNTQFSTKRNVAATLLYGALDGNFYAGNTFHERKKDIASLAQKVHLKLDWEMTVRLARGFDAGIDHGGKPGLLGMGSAGKTLKLMKKAVGSRKLLGVEDLPALLRLKSKDRAYFLRRYWRGYRAKLPFFSAKAREAWVSRERDLSQLRFHLSGRVKILLKNGQRYDAECDIPPGFAGDPQRMEVAKAKFFRECVPVLGEQASQKLFQAYSPPS